MYELSETVCCIIPLEAMQELCIISHSFSQLGWRMHLSLLHWPYQVGASLKCHPLKMVRPQASPTLLYNTYSTPLRWNFKWQKVNSSWSSSVFWFPCSIDTFLKQCKIIRNRNEKSENWDILKHEQISICCLLQFFLITFWLFSWPMRIVGPIQFWKGWVIYVNIFFFF